MGGPDVDPGRRPPWRRSWPGTGCSLATAGIAGSSWLRGPRTPPA